MLTACGVCSRVLDAPHQAPRERSDRPLQLPRIPPLCHRSASFACAVRQARADRRPARSQDCVSARGARGDFYLAARQRIVYDNPCETIVSSSLARRPLDPTAKSRICPFPCGRTTVNWGAGFPQLVEPVVNQPT